MKQNREQTDHQDQLDLWQTLERLTHCLYLFCFFCPSVWLSLIVLTNLFICQTQFFSFSYFFLVSFESICLSYQSLFSLCSPFSSLSICISSSSPIFGISFLAKTRDLCTCVTHLGFLVLIASSALPFLLLDFITI